MFKLTAKWFDGDGEECRVPCFVLHMPRVGEHVDLSAQSNEAEQWRQGGGRRLECMRVLAVEHGACAPHDSDPKASSGLPDVTLLLERDPAVQHQLDLEDERAVADELRKYLTRLVVTLNALAAEFTFGGEFGLVPREDSDRPSAPGHLLAYRHAVAAESSIPGIVLELADVVYTPAPGPQSGKWFRCVKHCYRDSPYETTWTGIA